MNRTRKAIALAVAVIGCGVAASVTAPSALATSCSDITYTHNTSYGLYERITVIVSNEGSTEAEGVSIGGAAWSIYTSHIYATYTSVTFQASYLARGTYAVAVDVKGTYYQSCDPPGFTIS